MVAVTLKSGIIALGVAVLASCASRTQSQWFNSRVSQDMLQHRFSLDATECAALARQMIPEPAIPVPRTGALTLNTPSGPVHGTYRSEPEQSMTPGLDAVQREARRDQRMQYAYSCLASRGWEQRRVQ